MKAFLPRIALIAALSLAAAAPAQAEVISAKVNRIYPAANGVVNFSLAGSCKHATPYSFQFTLNSDITRAWYTLLLTAATNKTTVRVAIADACSSTANQTVGYIYQDF